MVKSRVLRPYRGRPGFFLVLGLADRTGEIEAKLWENAEEWYRRIRDLEVLEVYAKTEVFNGNLELSVDRLRIAREQEYRLEDFLPASERDPDDMIAALRQTIQRIESPHLSALLKRFFSDDELRQFFRAPAAKQVHHAYLGGLLEHTLEVVKLCDTYLEMNPALDRDVLLTAAILHDVGKIREYVYDRCIDFSDEGRLLGHISLGEQMLVQRASAIEGFPEDLLLRLRHMILSHHGQYEWQSPKRPKTIEACVLHQADYFSCQMAMVSSLIKANADNASAWTAYSKFLERSIFIGRSRSQLRPDDPARNPRQIMEDTNDYYY